MTRIVWSLFLAEPDLGTVLGATPRREMRGLIRFRALVLRLISAASCHLQMLFWPPPGKIQNTDG